MQRCGGVTTSRGQGERGRPDVHVRGEARVGQRHEQQRPAEAAHEPREHAAAHGPRLPGHLEHVAHQPGAELSQQADRGHGHGAARAERVVHGERELRQARDRVDGAPGRVTSEQQTPGRRVAAGRGKKKTTERLHNCTSRARVSIV